MILLIRKLRQIIKPVIFLGLSGFFLASCQPQPPGYAGYLFAYFTGNGPGQEQIHYALSWDGYHYRALNDNQPVIRSKSISNSGAVIFKK